MNWTRRVGRCAVLVPLALGALCFVWCRPPKPARELLEMNVELVTEQKLERVSVHAYRVAMMLIDEPVWEGEGPWFDRERLLEQKEFYRGQFRWSLIRDWLAMRYEPGSDLRIADVYEFRTLAQMREFLGCDPEQDGIPVVKEVASRFTEYEPVLWPAERIQYISNHLPSHFSRSIWPLIVRRGAEGREWTGLELAEESRVVDRWAVGYVTSAGTVYGTLLLRVRGLWALWPFVR